MTDDKTASQGKEVHGNELPEHNTTRISGFSRVYEGRTDENLPEVYVDDTPQAVSKQEQQHAAFASDEAQSPKFAVGIVYGDDSPRSAVPPEYDSIGHALPPDRPAATSPPADAGSTGGSQPPNDRRICGIGRRKFVIILAVVLIIIAAAVGGGVGGAVAASASKSGSSDEKDDDSRGFEPTTTTASSTSSEPPSTTTSETETPSATPEVEFLNNQTHVTDEFAFQGFSEQDYGGNATDILSLEDGVNFNFSIASYVWAPQNTGCCLTFCMNATEAGNVGWLCSARKQPESSDRFRRIFVWCGEVHSGKNAVCSDPDD